MSTAISIQNLTVRFGDVVAVDNVSLDFEEGEFISIVGPSGCGKTTILNMLTGLMPVQQGQVSLLGKTPFGGNPDIAYMLARDCLLPWRTTLDNAMYGTEVRGMDPLESERHARELLARVGLKGFEDAYPKHLSHGMRQRCALARTFALDSPVLLMDEPFGAGCAYQVAARRPVAGTVEREKAHGGVHHPRFVGGCGHVRPCHRHEPKARTGDSRRTH
jgi:NitT/TauT family transport system ATP-binding protein